MPDDSPSPKATVREEESGADGMRLKEFEYDMNKIIHAVSHDLRAPLRGISGFARALEEDYGAKLDATGLDYLARIRQGAKRMDRMIDGVLTLARIPQSPVAHENADVTYIANDLLTSISERHPSRKVTVTVEPALTAISDRALIRILLRELLENAWKFTAENSGATIRVARVDAPAGRFAFSIGDNGTGFDAEAAGASGKLFGMFERFHGPDRFEGEGAGLAIAQGVARHLGGFLKVESRPGDGALFICEVIDHKK